MTDPPELARGIRLYHDVFDIPPSQTGVGLRLLAALAHHGGFALSATIGTSMVGFAYGFVGTSETYTDPYLYLQVIAVRRERQGIGIGRAMMYWLAELARQRGFSRLRWAFDPLQTRNAHFYLDVIGARGSHFVPNMYGPELDGSGRTVVTDRVIADWDLAAGKKEWRPPFTVPPPGISRPDGQSVLVTMGPDDQRIRTLLAHLMADGYEFVSCQRVRDRVVARLLPGRELPAPHHRMSSWYNFAPPSVRRAVPG